MDAPVPVTVVTGFLGAGKTTRVNRWLGDLPRGEIAVIVNELGEVGIDGALLAARARTLVEIAGGCICCTTHAELVQALDDLAAAQPARILVETSGAASPAGVLRAIASGGPHGRHALDGVITIVDASRIAQLDAHDLAIEQLGFADVVVLSRVDRIDRATLDEAAAVVAAHNGAAVIAHDAPSLTALLDRRASEPTLPRIVRAARHAIYASISLAIDGELDGDRFAAFMEDDLAAIGGRLFRTKGILAIAGIAERMIVQGVADQVEVAFGEPWGDAPRISRLVLVGFGLDRAALADAFAACRAP